MEEGIQRVYVGFLLEERIPSLFLRIAPVLVLLDKCVRGMLPISIPKNIRLWLWTWNNLLPSKLVIFIVNLDDRIHLSWIRIFVLPSPTLSNHRIPEHLLRGIEPRSVRAVFWDRARLTLG